MQSLESLPKFLVQVSQDIHQAGGASYLVGGWVRDALLGVESKDYDIEVYGLEEDELLNLLRPYGKPSSVGKSFGVYIMRVQGIHYDFSFPRTETKVGQGHRGFEVQADPHLNFEVASSRRDFTINAMGYNLFTLEIEDPQQGQRDLASGTLRHVGPAFGEDPLRALRAIQFIGRFNLSVPQETVQICQEQDLSELSTERFEEEFKKLLLKSKHITRALDYLVEMQLIRFFPELSSVIPVTSIDEAHDYLKYFEDERDQLIFMYTLLTLKMNDTDFESFMARFTNDAKLLKGIRSRRVAFEHWTGSHDTQSHDVKNNDVKNPGVIRRMALNCPIQEFMLYVSLTQGAILQIQSIQEAIATQRITYLLEKPEALDSKLQAITQSAQQWGVFTEAPQPWFQGRDLIAEGFKPGPKFGVALKECFEKQLDEEFKDPQAAKDWLIGELQESP